MALARALVGDPPVLLLDEPSGNLDQQAEQELRSLLAELGRDHTIVLVTHSPALLAAADSLMVLEQGRIALAGPARELLPRLSGRPVPVPKEPAGTAGAPA